MLILTYTKCLIIPVSKSFLPSLPLPFPILSPPFPSFSPLSYSPPASFFLPHPPLHKLSHRTYSLILYLLFPFPFPTPPISPHLPFSSSHPPIVSLLQSLHIFLLSPLPSSPLLSLIPSLKSPILSPAPFFFLILTYFLPFSYLLNPLIPLTVLPLPHSPLQSPNHSFTSLSQPPSRS